MRRKRLRLSSYNLIKESKGAITGASTVDELIAMGLLKSDFLLTANAKLGKQQQKDITSAESDSKLEIARVAIAYFLVSNYGMIPDGTNLHDVRSSKDDKGRKIGFGKKPSEKIVAKVFDTMSIDYNQKVGGAGSARFYIEQVFKDLEESGILTNNRALVSNNAHVRYGKFSDPSVPDKLPLGFPQGKDFPTLKEFMEPFMNQKLVGDSDLLALLDDMTYYIADPDGLKAIADQCDSEICDLVDQFADEAMSDTI
jgi:hypothetical protein